MSSIGFPDGQRITQWLGTPQVVGNARAIGNVLRTDGPFNLASWASVVVAIKPTGGSVTVTVRQQINGGPASLELPTQFHVAAGVTVFETVVLLGDTVYLDLLGSAPGVTVDYALYPANTTTNAQVASGVVDAAARIFQNYPVAVVIPNGAWTTIPLPLVEFSTDAAMVAAANAITIVEPGIYAVTAGVLWSVQPSVYGQVTVWRNGIPVAGIPQAGAQVAGTNGTTPGFADHYLCTAGDVLTAKTYQQAGGQAGGGWLSASLVATL